MSINRPCVPGSIPGGTTYKESFFGVTLFFYIRAIAQLVEQRTDIPFTKRFESSENLVNLLESRGLQICDRNKAIQYLDNIGYYRLSAYMYPLLKMPKTAHLYKEGSTFKKVMMLYRFDKKLRLLMFNEIEKIEIAIRRAVMQTNLLRILPTIVDFR